ncbi:MAG: S8 family serine peptidase [Acidobacteriota bacterium]
MGSTATPALSVESPHVAGELLVKFAPSTLAARRVELRDRVGAQAAQPLFGGSECLALSAGTSVADAVALLADEPDVLYAEPNYLVSIAAVPNDPLFHQLYGLNNTGQTGGSTDADIDAPEAWDRTVGSHDVVVAVVDTGVNLAHADLAANLWTNPGEIPNNGVDDDHNGFVDDDRGWDFINGDNNPGDDQGHGTHVAGTIGAIGDNGIGVTGVCWDVSIMPVKFLGRDGRGPIDAAIEAIAYAVDNGATISNHSWGFFGDSQALGDAVQAASDAGHLMVVAAGNNRSDLDRPGSPGFRPASYDVPGLIAVAATDHRDELASFSNFGLETVDLAAPGVEILSTELVDYERKSGTSMATPHVAGTAALIESVCPGIDRDLTTSLLFDNVEPLPDLEGKTVTGGRLNAALPPDSQRPSNPRFLYVFGEVTSDTAVLRALAGGDDRNRGQACSLDLRYSPDGPPTVETWDSALPLSGAPSPALTTSWMEFVAEGLPQGTTSWVALRALDEAGNMSGVGEVVEVTTLPPPTIMVSPASLDVTVPSGEVGTATLTILAGSEGVLDWELETPSTGGPDHVPSVDRPEPALCSCNGQRLLFQEAVSPQGEWASGTPYSGRLYPDEAAEVTVSFDTRALPVGTYDGTVAVRSNDPLSPRVEIALTLTVTARPRLELGRRLAGALLLEGARIEDGSCQSRRIVSTHSLPFDLPPRSVELFAKATGNFNRPDAGVLVRAEGSTLGLIPGRLDPEPCPRCVQQKFTLTDQLREQVLADGLLEVTLLNHPDRQTCLIDFDIGMEAPPVEVLGSHHVVLSYEPDMSRMLFGEALVGEELVQTIELHNLQVSGAGGLINAVFTTDPSFSVSSSGGLIAPGGSAVLTVRFSPTDSSPLHEGLLVIETNDPAQPRFEVLLQGRHPVEGDIDGPLTGGIATGPLGLGLR